MKPATGVVLLLAVVVVLYFVALGVGLAFNRGGGGTSVDDIGSGWKKALGSMSGLFAPKLDLRAIDCNGQPVTGLFKLTEASAGCSLRFPASGDDYRKGELDVLRTPATNDLAVLVRAEFNETYIHFADHDPSTCFTDPPPDPLTGQIPLPQKVLDIPLRLQIRYVPNEESDAETWKCWLLQDPTEPFGFAVLADGGSLALECVGCSAGAQRELTLRLK